MEDCMKMGFWKLERGDEKGEKRPLGERKKPFLEGKNKRGFEK